MHGGQLIKNRRMKLGLTQQQIADACGVSKSAVCKWQSGDIGNMRRDRIAALSKILGISPMQIIEADSAQQLTLSNVEVALIECYRKLPTEKQATVNDIVIALYRSQKANEQT